MGKSTTKLDFNIKAEQYKIWFDPYSKRNFFCELGKNGLEKNKAGEIVWKKR